jgi:transcriptional regulator with XRE-family HTH domain
VRRHRLNAGLSVEELAARAGVTATWLAAFEAGERTQELTYDRLLALVRATQPERPDWWDEGHEHDLHLGPQGAAEPQSPSAKDYWARIESVRAANRFRDRR